MKGMNWKCGNLLLLPLMMCSSMVFAERSGFYTIVGPDGRIMVIDRNAATVPVKPAASSSIDDKPAAQQDRPATVSGTTVTPPPQPAVTSQVKQPETAPVIAGQDKPLPADKAQSGVVQGKQNQQDPVAADTQPTAKVSRAKVSSPANASALPVTTVKSPAVSGAYAGKTQATDSPVVPTDRANAAATPVTVINGEQYIDSEYLEQREFNLEGKKRFYSLPDGMGRTQVLEREKGVDMSVFKGPKVDVQKVITLSKDYERLDAQKVVGLTGVQCFSEKQLEKAKTIKEKETVDFWPRPSFEPRFDFVLAKFDTEVSDIEFTSYAGSMRNPAFYWPLPIFLDKNACVMEGVNAFYQRTINATSLQHQGLQGFLHVPAGARYILLTPLEAAADLSNIKLTNKGQIRLTPVR